MVVHNSASFIEKRLAAVRAGRKDHSYELILVDNAATDGTCEAIPLELKPQRTIALDSNIGFPRATNVGIEQRGGRPLHLVNSDAFPIPAWRAGGSKDEVHIDLCRQPRPCAVRRDTGSEP